MERGEIKLTLSELADVEKQLKADAVKLLKKIIIELTDENREKAVNIWLNNDIKVKGFNADGSIKIEVIDDSQPIEIFGEEIENAETDVDIDSLSYSECVDLINYIWFYTE